MHFISGEISSPILYISTDYVFDGKNPPYKISDEPNPLNFYGKTKLDGEKGCLTANPGKLQAAEIKFNYIATEIIYYCYGVYLCLVLVFADFHAPVDFNCFVH